MNNPLSPPPSNKIVYHYTDMNALIHILRRDNIALRATNCLYLNDSNEIIEGIKSVNRVEQNHNLKVDDFKNFYITSFSEIEDSLNMWGMYAANGSGIALGFHLETIRQHYRNFLKCTYGQEEIDQHLKNALFLSRRTQGVFFPDNGKSQIVNRTDEDIANMVNMQLAVTCLAAKNEAYRSESEIRCFVRTFEDDIISFKTKNGTIIPYVNIGIAKDALKEIIIGPTNQQDISCKSIENFLELNGYKNITIKKSAVPYRG